MKLQRLLNVNNDLKEVFRTSCIGKQSCEIQSDKSKSDSDCLTDSSDQIIVVYKCLADPIKVKQKKSDRRFLAIAEQSNNTISRKWMARIVVGTDLLIMTIFVIILKIQRNGKDEISQEA